MDGNGAVPVVKRHFAAVQTGVNAGERQGLALCQQVIVRRVRKGQRQNTGVDKVGGVNPMML